MEGTNAIPAGAVDLLKEPWAANMCPLVSSCFALPVAPPAGRIQQINQPGIANGAVHVPCVGPRCALWCTDASERPAGGMCAIKKQALETGAVADSTKALTDQVYQLTEQFVPPSSGGIIVTLGRMNAEIANLAAKVEKAAKEGRK